MADVGGKALQKILSRPDSSRKYVEQKYLNILLRHAARLIGNFIKLRIVKNLALRFSPDVSRFVLRSC